MLRLSTRSDYLQNTENTMPRLNLTDNPDHFITELEKRVSGLDYGAVLGNLISKKAKLDLKIHRDQVKIPENLLKEIKAEDTSAIKNRKEEYLNYREELLTSIPEHKVIIFKIYTDGDGSLINKAKDPSNIHAWGEAVNITTQRSGFPNQNVITKTLEESRKIQCRPAKRSSENDARNW
jgi:hypothetical protein